MTNRRGFLKYVLGLAGLATGVPIAVKASGGDGSSPNDDEVMCAAEDCGTPIAPGDATPTAPEWEPPVAVDPDDEWWATITELPTVGSGPYRLTIQSEDVNISWATDDLGRWWYSHGWMVWTPTPSLNLEGAQRYVRNAPHD